MPQLPFPQTVRARLTLWNTFVLALILFALAGALRIVVATSLMNSVDKDLEGRAKVAVKVAEFYAPLVATKGLPDFPPEKKTGTSNTQAGFPWPKDTGAPSQWQTRVVEKWFDSKGHRLVGPKDDKPLDSTAFSLATAGTASYSTVRIAGEAVRVYSAPVPSLRQSIPGTVVQEGYSLIDVDRALSNLDRALLMLIPVGLFASGIGGLFLTGRMLRPLREATQAAARISAADLSQRLPVAGSDEFSVLAVTLNGMLARLEMSFEQQRRFTADASHELRTPLTVIKSAASRAMAREDLPEDQKRIMERIDRAAGLMSGVIQDLLLLARSDAGQLEIPFHPILMRDVLKEAIACTATEDSPTIINLADTENGLLWVQGDMGHLTRLFSNLINNAVRHTPATGSITLSVVPETNNVIVRVADTGEGIAPEHLPHVTERFYRADASRTRAHGGTGLGLAICQSIATAHGGSLHIKSQQGTGTVITVTLPRLPDAAREIEER